MFNTGERFMGTMKNKNLIQEGTFVSQKGIMTGHWEGSKLINLL